MKRYFVFLILLCLAPFVGAVEYKDIQAGQLSGKLIVQWLEPDVFLFIPDKNNPLTFKRKDGTVIKPERMLTDGGSIPRPIWAFRNYSPWGYAPAFIVHDWVFHLKHCGKLVPASLKLEDAGMIMAEVMKTMMESGKVERSEMTVRLMHEAVTSPIARALWNENKCVAAPPAFNVEPKFEYEISFP